MADPTSTSPSTINQNVLTLFIGVVVLFVVRWFLTEFNKKHYKSPPGPRPFPIVGNLPQIIRAKEFFRRIMEFRKIYGGIFKISVGPYTTVFVSDLDIVKEGLITKGESLKGRPSWLFLFKKIFRNRGVIFNSGHVWRDLRRFTLSTLRNFGVGKKSLEEKIHEEILEVSSAIEAHNGKPFVLKKHIADGTFNIIYNIIFGQRLEYTAPRFNEFIQIFDYLFKNAGLQIPENFFPWLQYIRKNSPVQTMIKNDEILRAYVREKIQEHRETFDADNLRDFIDMYILMTQEEKSESYSEMNIFRTIVDLFTAGSETTATSLLWVLLYLTKYPEIQHQCREEIRKLTGFSRMITMADREELPFINATILEVQRIASVAVFVAPHVAEEDITLGDFDVLKGTIVIFNINALHNDPRYWENPEKFLPERWLTKENKIKKHEAFLPFSWGPRSCLGEPLARMEMFLFFTNLLQRFEFTNPPDEPVSLSAQVTGVTYQPIKTLICAKSL